MEKLHERVSVKDYQTRSPVLIIGHRRVETTRQVIEAVRGVGAPRVFFFVDGARSSRPGEIEQVQKVRSLADTLDWGCDVEKFYPSENLGCQRGVTAAIDWFFSSVPEGIVLEDDCVPQRDFFQFCDQLLEQYRHDERIVHIGGTNPLRFDYDPGASYFFSEYFHIWGWASWSRAVVGFRDLITSSPHVPALSGPSPGILSESRVAAFWAKRWLNEKKRTVDNWSSLWNLHTWNLGGLSIVPRENLVTNIGFGKHGTHATKFPLIAGYPPQSNEIAFPLTAPNAIQPDSRADKYVTRAVYGIMPGVLRPVLAGLEAIRRIAATKREKPSQRYPLTVAQLFWSWLLKLRT